MGPCERQRSRHLGSWPGWLRKIDALLEDEAVIEVVARVLETRWPQSRRRGRPGTPRDALVRSYRKLMATTRAEVRDAATMVCRVSQRLRTASAATASILTRARQQLHQMRPLLNGSWSKLARGSWTATRTGPTKC